MSSHEVSAAAVDRRSRRFGIAWRNRVDRSIHDVAVLDVLSSSYQFRYRADVGLVDGFRPFIGFPELDRVYVSSRLWPFFDLRIMDRRRPDYAQYVGWLGLPLDADRLDVLARHGGEPKGDTVSLTEAPAVDLGGATSTTFIVRGSRFAVRSSGSDAVAERLRPGDRLGVRHDKTNEANPAALLLTAADAPVGWIPDLLIEYAREVVASGGTITVVKNNGPEAPWHLRLLARLEGKVPEGWSTFADAEWPPLPLDDGR